MLDEIIKNYNDAVFDTDRQRAMQIVDDALAKGVSAEDIVFKIVIPAVNIMVQSISQSKESNLAQHFMTSQIAADVVENMVTKFQTTPKTIGTVVIGTPIGDFHSLGKRIVSGCLKSMMIHVVDLGNNVSAETFVDEAVKNSAQVIAISAMMLHTARGGNGCTRVREILKDRDLEDKIKIVVGGAPFKFDTQLYKTVGADAWASDGVSAAEIISNIIQKESM